MADEPESEGPDFKLPDLPEPPSQKEIEARLGRKKARFESSLQEHRRQEARRADSPTSQKGLSVGIAAAGALVVTPLVGIGVGYLLDIALNTALFRLLGALVGGIIGIWYVLRLSSRL